VDGDGDGDGAGASLLPRVHHSLGAIDFSAFSGGSSPRARVERTLCLRLFSVCRTGASAGFLEIGEAEAFQVRASDTRKESC
jgi:hypothetical protein